MRSPDQIPPRSSKAPLLSVESLEGRQLLSVPGPPPPGRDFPVAGFVVHVELAVPADRPMFLPKDTLLEAKLDTWAAGGFEAIVVGGKTPPGLFNPADVPALGRASATGDLSTR